MAAMRGRGRIIATAIALSAMGISGAPPAWGEDAWFLAADAELLMAGAQALPRQAATPAPLERLRDIPTPECLTTLEGLDAAVDAGRAEKLSCLKAAFALRTSPGRELGGSPLRPEERAVMAKYVDYFAYLINKAMRTGDRPFLSKHGDYVAALIGALDRSPVFRGVVFRGADFPPAGARLADGAEFVDPAFVSTSRSRAIGEHYTKADGYLYAILSRSGRVLAYDRSTESLSVEDEVLFKPGTRFIILAVMPDPENRRTVVYAEEARP